MTCYQMAATPTTDDTEKREDAVIQPTEAAWLAGLWDGEGSVGVAQSRATGSLILIPQLQINMTHEPTLVRVVELFHQMGFHATHYQTTRKQNHHKDAYLVAIRRTAWVKLTAETLLPYALTKRQQWELMLELCDERIARQGLASSGGWLKRGGAPGWSKAYTGRELEITAELSAINARPIKEVSGVVAG